MDTAAHPSSDPPLVGQQQRDPYSRIALASLQAFVDPTLGVTPSASDTRDLPAQAEARPP